MHNCPGYDVTCLAARPSRSRVDQGGFGMVTRESPIRWGVDSTRYHGPNVVSCEIVTRFTRIPLVGAYLPPSTLEHLPCLEEAMQSFRDPIVLGDLNLDLKEARSP